jgi:hypothetical protein
LPYVSSTRSELSPLHKKFIFQVNVDFHCVIDYGRKDERLVGFGGRGLGSRAHRWGGVDRRNGRRRRTWVSNRTETRNREDTGSRQDSKAAPDLASYPPAPTCCITALLLKPFPPRTRVNPRCPAYSETAVS